MDLSLTLNDSFYVSNFFSPGFHRVDSIYFISGKKFVQLDLPLYYSPSNEKLTFIEGSGTNAGLDFMSNAGLQLNPYLYR